MIISLTRENTHHSSQPNNYLRDAIEGSATQHIRGKIKPDNIALLKPIENHHQFGALLLASEKLTKAVSTDKLKMTNSLKKQMYVCNDNSIFKKDDEVQKKVFKS